MNGLMMAKKKIFTCSEGDCFVFPLKDGGFARGVIARNDHASDRPIGKLLGYFFRTRSRPFCENGIVLD